MKNSTLMSLLNRRYLQHLEQKNSLMYSTFNRVLLDLLQTVRLIGTGHFGANRIKNSGVSYISIIFSSLMKHFLKNSQLGCCTLLLLSSGYFLQVFQALNVASNYKNSTFNRNRTFKWKQTRISECTVCLIGSFSRIRKQYT